MLTIAIDGPASSGKSTIARLLAERLNIIYVDTGAMYRGITYYMLTQGKEIDSQADFSFLEEIDLSFEYINGLQHILLNGQDLTHEIRGEEVTKYVSPVAAIPQVRDYLVSMQQKMAAKTSLVMDGRDIGTTVLPQATYKFYFEASPEVRALRRYKENQALGYTKESLEEIKKGIIERDHYDMNRPVSPLKPAQDAIIIDTSDLTIEEVLQKIEEIIH
ncbi:(d)CMP kinase [Dolosicoccus paucivorans]|uniref:Cytidylate kinase n=1 Tax=Dolosicoccus paucivorans TaxID=84521 RepID=A0A1G8KZ14_9LACT|nr:(d)CMP kinase [Dolosicoccus paucivorans]PMB85117.1 (d)CMP kinase [Dolosicoccus paucivorans]PMC58919.1 (d)CMP kinase [Dolosicoccus paucivorans]SDI48587.1 cytidylate kinase [Dolosicoccus paucivorans]